MTPPRLLQNRDIKKTLIVICEGYQTSSMTTSYKSIVRACQHTSTPTQAESPRAHTKTLSSQSLCLYYSISVQSHTVTANGKIIENIVSIDRVDCAPAKQKAKQRHTVESTTFDKTTNVGRKHDGTVGNNTKGDNRFLSIPFSKPIINRNRDENAISEASTTFKGKCALDSTVKHVIKQKTTEYLACEYN